MPEIIALKLCENNPFYNGTYFAFWDGESNYGYNTYGNFTIDVTKDPHWVTFTTTEGKIYYGIFRVNETGDRPTLLLEYNDSTRPTDFTENAVLYTLGSRANPRWEKPNNLSENDMDGKNGKIERGYELTENLLKTFIPSEINSQLAIYYERTRLGFLIETDIANEINLI